MARSTKPEGIVRKFDGLGRIVIPKEYRTSMNITDDTPMEILKVGKSIVLTPVKAKTCGACGH